MQHHAARRVHPVRREATDDYCKYQPSCSEYMIGTINEFGVFKGLYLGIKRICRCNFFSSGGYDPIPIKGGKCEKNK